MNAEMKNDDRPGITVSVVPAEWTCHLAFALLALSYLSSDFVTLRGLAVAGAASNILFYFFRPQPLYLPMKWNFAFLLINLIFVAILLFEERQASAALDSEPELQAVFDSVFRPAGMSMLDFRRLMSIAKWHDVEPGEQLCREGHPSYTLYLIVRGKASVVVKPSRAQAQQHKQLKDTLTDDTQALAGASRTRLLGRAVRDMEAKRKENKQQKQQVKGGAGRHGAPSAAPEEMLVAVGGAGSFVSEMSFLRGFEKGWDDLAHYSDASVAAADTNVTGDAAIDDDGDSDDMGDENTMRHLLADSQGQDAISSDAFETTSMGMGMHDVRSEQTASGAGARRESTSSPVAGTGTPGSGESSSKRKRRGASATVRASSQEDLRQAYDLAIHVAQIKHLEQLSAALPRFGQAGDGSRRGDHHPRKGVVKRGERQHDTRLRVVKWDFSELRAAMMANPSLDSAVRSAIGQDLVRKVETQKFTTSRREELTNGELLEEQGSVGGEERFAAEVRQAIRRSKEAQRKRLQANRAKARHAAAMKRKASYPGDEAKYGKIGHSEESDGTSDPNASLSSVRFAKTVKGFDGRESSGRAHTADEEHAEDRSPAPQGGSWSKRRRFVFALEGALLDGQVTQGEREGLEEMRIDAQISKDEHERLLESFGWTYSDYKAGTSASERQ